MAPRGSKRAATQDPVGQPAAKKIPQGVAKSNFKAVVDLLEHPLAYGFPENCRKMLTAMLPTSLCVASDERHPHQAMVVDMVGDVTEEVESRMKTSIDTAAARLTELESSRPEFDRQKSEAEAKLAVALADVDARRLEFSDASAQVAEAKALLSEKQQALKAVEAPLKPIRKEKESLETMMSTDFNLAEWEAGKMKKRCNAVVSFAKKLSFDASLISSLPGSLSKKPDERTSFDGMVLQQFEAGVLEKVQQLSATLETGSISSADCVAAVAEAQSEFEKRKEVSDAAAAILQAAQSDHRENVANLKAATDAVENYEPEVEKAKNLHDEKVEELKVFQEWNVFCYKSMKDRVSAKRSKELAELAELAEVAEVVETEQAAVVQEAVEEKAVVGDSAAMPIVDDPIASDVTEAVARDSETEPAEHAAEEVPVDAVESEVVVEAGVDQ